MAKRPTYSFSNAELSFIREYYIEHRKPSIKQLTEAFNKEHGTKLTECVIRRALGEANTAAK